MIDRRIMIRELRESSPSEGLHNLVASLEAQPVLDSALHQLYLTVVIDGGRIIETEDDLRCMNRSMGWDKPNYCWPA